MDTFGTGQLQTLIDEQTSPCVTVYLPTHPTGEQGQQDRLRLKNLLQKAEVELSENWLRPAEARELLEPARDRLADAVFWTKRSHGLAIFLAPGSFHCYRLRPTFEELVFVNRRFHLKPLMPLLEGGDHFMVLALSQNKVQLFDASRWTIEPVDLGEVPTNLKDALNHTQTERGSQVHSAARGGEGKQGAVFHGQGGQPDTRKEELLQFFRVIDSGLQPLLREQSVPLLLAGVEYLLPLYREVSSYPHLVEKELTGNFDYVSAQEIHRQAWRLIEPTLQHSRDQAWAKYRQMAGTGKASDDLSQILPAAYQGKIETLFVDLHVRKWGLFHDQTAAVELHEDPQTGDDDLLDLAATQTLLHRGAVYPLDRGQTPQQEPAAAVFRY